MKFRVARHTDDLQPIINFYIDILGLEIIGEFKDHSNYDGVFFGKEGLDWHLEFTKSGDSTDHKPGEDDLLVFYVDSEKEYIKLNNKFNDKGISPVVPKNPYWKENGTTYSDPDGFRIVISILEK
jgi:catechol 2,3-dioxygenase-like lactoylglutathione lyase family enzyme